VPFSNHSGLVACRLEKFGDGHLPGAQTIAVNSAHQGGPGWPATGGVIELGKAQAVLGQFVQVGRVDFPAEASEVGKAHVVGENDDDVGTFHLFSREM